MRTIPKFLVAVSAMALALGLVSPALAQEDKVVATVNGQPITETQLTDQMLMRYGDRTLLAMMQELAIEQAAAEAGVTVTDAEVQKRVQELQTSIDVKAPQTGQSFTLWLAEKKMTVVGLMAFMRSELLLEKMVKSQVNVTDQQVAEAWERGKGLWRRPEKMHVRHICVKTKDEADRIRQNLAGGQDFAQAAAAHSIDPYSKDSGGDIGWIPRGEKAFQVAAFALTQDGQVSEPVQTVMGWHIIQRIEHRPASSPNFEDVQGEIRDYLESQTLLQLMNNKRAETMAKARINQELEIDSLLSTAEPGG